MQRLRIPLALSGSKKNTNSRPDSTPDGCPTIVAAAKKCGPLPSLPPKTRGIGIHNVREHGTSLRESGAGVRVRAIMGASPTPSPISQRLAA